LQLQGHDFQDFPALQEKSLTVLHIIPQNQFQWCFLQR